MVELREGRDALGGAKKAGLRLTLQVSRVGCVLMWYNGSSPFSDKNCTTRCTVSGFKFSTVGADPTQSHKYAHTLGNAKRLAHGQPYGTVCPFRSTCASRKVAAGDLETL